MRTNRHKRWLPASRSVPDSRAETKIGDAVFNFGPLARAFMIALVALAASLVVILVMAVA